MGSKSQRKKDNIGSITRETALSLKKDIADVLDYKEKITRIFFIRHGETKANKHKLLFGHLNWDLNKDGIKQIKVTAHKVFKLLNNQKADLIISSPLIRAKHSAKIIARILNVKKIIVDKNLIEKSEGSWEGKTYWDIRKSDPYSYYNWIKNPFKNRPSNGESVLDLNKRVKNFRKTIFKKYPGKNIIVVTHSGPIRLFLLNLLGLDIEKFWYLKVDCASISEVHLSKKHAMIWSVNV